MSLTGKCFCGAVEIEVTGSPEAMGYCHCRSCRSWSGGPVNAFSLWKPEAVQITSGGEHVAMFQMGFRQQRQRLPGARHALQVDAMAHVAIHHFPRELLVISAVQKIAFTLHPDPDGRAAYSDLNRRFHNNYRTLWNLALAVKQTSPIRKSVSRLRSGRVR